MERTLHTVVERRNDLIRDISSSVYLKNLEIHSCFLGVNLLKLCFRSFVGNLSEMR